MHFQYGGNCAPVRERSQAHGPETGEQAESPESRDRGAGGELQPRVRHLEHPPPLHLSHLRLDDRQPVHGADDTLSQPPRAGGPERTPPARGLKPRSEVPPSWTTSSASSPCSMPPASG